MARILDSNPCKKQHTQTISEEIYRGATCFRSSGVDYTRLDIPKEVCWIESYFLCE